MGQFVHVLQFLQAAPDTYESGERKSEFGTGSIPVVTIDVPPYHIRKLTGIKQYVDETSASRIYAGVHYRTSAVVGQEMGRKIGELAVQKYMKPIR